MTLCDNACGCPGNELCGEGVAARVEARQYGKDVIALKELVKELYPDPSTQPKVLGPAGFYDEKWFNEFLETTGPGVVDGLTHHIYNLGAGTYYIGVQIRAKFTQILDQDNVSVFFFVQNHPSVSAISLRFAN